MAPSTTLIATIFSEPTIVVALIAAAAAVGGRAFPKTRTEAGVDRAQARKTDAESWDLLVARLEKQNADLDADVEKLKARVVDAEDRARIAEAEAREAREALAEEREHADEQIRGLIERITVLEAAAPPARVFWRE